MRFFADRLRPLTHAATGGGALAVFAATDNPQTRDEKRFALETMDDAEAKEDDMVRFVTYATRFGVKEIQIRGIDAFKIVPHNFLDVLRAYVPLRGFCDGTSPRSRGLYELDLLTIRVMVPLMSDYPKGREEYIPIHYGIAATLLRDRVLNFIQCSASRPKTVVEIPYLYTFSELEQAETLYKLRDYADLIRFPADPNTT